MQRKNNNMCKESEKKFFKTGKKEANNCFKQLTKHIENDSVYEILQYFLLTPYVV